MNEKWFHRLELSRSSPLKDIKIKNVYTFGLTFVFRDDLTRVNFELDGGLNKGGVVLKHLVISIKNVVFLDEVADVVKSRGPNIPTRTF